MLRRTGLAACLTLALTLSLTPAVADTAPETETDIEAMLASIQNHAIQRLYATEPCIAVIAVLDDDFAVEQTNLENAFAMAMLTGDFTSETMASVEVVVGAMAENAMVWGHLLGFETANPGIRGTHKTILMRLRADCATDPTRTALEWLTAYAAE